MAGARMLPLCAPPAFAGTQGRAGALFVDVRTANSTRLGNVLTNQAPVQASSKRKFAHDTRYKCTSLLTRSHVKKIVPFLCLSKEKEPKRKDPTKTAQRGRTAPNHPACRPTRMPSLCAALFVDARPLALLFTIRITSCGFYFKHSDAFLARNMVA